MNMGWAINEINLLREYYNDRPEFKNICKALKDIVLSYSKFDTSYNSTLYISEQIVELYRNTKGMEKELALEFCKDHLKELQKQANRSDTNPDIQAKVNNVIIQIMTILILVNKNSNVIFNYARMLLEYRPLTPITDNIDEWENVSDYFPDKRIVFQNKRARNVFMYKYNDDIEVKMIDAKYFSFNNGENWELNDASSMRLKLPTMVPRSEYIILPSNEE